MRLHGWSGVLLAACAGDPAARVEEALGVDVEVRETDLDRRVWLVTTITQPVDPEDPSAGTFEQRVSVLHRGWRAPVVLHTHGYTDTWGDALTEPAALLDANQISVEHRFFGESVPAPTDWSKLRLDAVAADLHAVVEAWRALYPGAWVSTGYSKGGVTALVHRAAYPDDVDGTVAYVAPFLDSPRDARFVDASRWQEPASCQRDLRALQIAALDRLDEITPFFERAWTYERVGVTAAVESILIEADWTFWQYVPSGYCAELPAPDAAPEEIAGWLVDLAGDSGSDGFVSAYGPYFWQSLAELGYPDIDLEPFAGHTRTDYWDWSGALPAPAPAFDGSVIERTRRWVERDAERVALVYGELDPWTTGAIDPAPGGDNARYDVSGVGHWAHLDLLGGGQREDALERLARWGRGER